MPKVVIGGAGPAGLTAAYELLRRGITSKTFDSDTQVGGISKTVQRDGWRFDIGGHRFFTKVPRVEAFWHEVLSDDDFMLRPRMSRIFYNGKFFDYPLRAKNALFNLGLFEAFLCVLSYIRVRLFPPKDQSNFEGWVAARFGWRLYRTFFKTYTEKVWGVPAESIQADWAAQRIKNLSLGTAIINSIFRSRNSSKQVTSLIEEFQYPKLGPGMLWEACAEAVRSQGSEVTTEVGISSIERRSHGEILIGLTDGSCEPADYFVSSLPINSLVQMLTPAAPASVLEAAARLRHRDFLTVALVVPEEFSFPDNWIYIHSPEVRVGRVQNYGSWSPHMVKEGRTCLGLEYFVNKGDALWNAHDPSLIDIATGELELLNLIPHGVVEQGFVLRIEKAYPVYDADYTDALNQLRMYLEQEWPEILPVGRNGMHRYNNQDHSMLAAMFAVENIVGEANHDVWTVNVDGDYQEEAASDLRRGTGRSAPVIS